MFAPFLPLFSPDLCQRPSPEGYHCCPASWRLNSLWIRQVISSGSFVLSFISHLSFIEKSRIFRIEVKASPPSLPSPASHASPASQHPQGAVLSAPSASTQTSSPLEPVYSTTTAAHQVYRDWVSGWVTVAVVSVHCVCAIGVVSVCE